MVVGQKGLRQNASKIMKELSFARVFPSTFWKAITWAGSACILDFSSIGTSLSFVRTILARGVRARQSGQGMPNWKPEREVRCEVNDFPSQGDKLMGGEQSSNSFLGIAVGLVFISWFRPKGKSPPFSDYLLEQAAEPVKNLFWLISAPKR
jgi:hypothetical protein